MRRALLAALLLASPAPAQQQPAGGLSLAAARAAAAEHNPEYRKARNDLSVAAAAERRSWGSFLPSLDLSMGVGGYSSTTVTGEDDFGKPIRLPDPIEFQRSSSNQSAMLGLTLFEGGRRVAELRAARAESRAARARVAAEVARLDAELARSYYDAVRYQRQAALEAELLESAREQLEATRRLLAVAARDPLDLLGAEVEVARQERAVAQARGAARKAILSLQALMGQEGPARYTLTDSLPPAFDPSGLDVDRLVAAALESSPGIAALDAAAAAADRRVSVARAGRWPTLRASASYSRGVGLAGYDALRELNPLNRSLSFGLSLSLPLFSQFQTSYQVAQARAGREDAQEDLRAARLLAEREVRSALIDLENAYSGVRLTERAAALARERLELAREQYRLGTLGFTELQEVVDQAAQAEREAITARLDFAAALVTLEEKAGRKINHEL